MYDIIILTTAIIRPSIHVKSFQSLKRFINTKIKILWIINIDFVNIYHKKINDSELTNQIINRSINNTKITILKLFSKYANIKFLFLYNKNGNFNLAVRNIINECKKHITNVKYGILYLEDDWILQKTENNIQYYLQRLDTVIGYKFSFATLKENGISFSPALWNKEYFENITIAAFNNNNNLDKDPESIVIEYYKNNFKHDPKKMVCLYNELIAFDIGRNWIKKTGFIKWNRKAKNNECIQYKYLALL